MFASRDVLFTVERKRRVFCAVTPILIKVITGHLNMECFESAVPAIFLSNAPTFFICNSKSVKFTENLKKITEKSANFTGKVANLQKKF